MVTRAQLSQERSRLRRDELLIAAIELFAEGGARAITHRAVAAQAGLPPATTTYYFESIDELIREALSAHIVRWIGELDSLATLDATTPVTLDLVTGFIPIVFERRGPDTAALQLSILLAAARDPQLRDLASAALEAFEKLIGMLLTKAGVPDVADLTASVAGLIGGTALRRQSRLQSEEVEARLLTTAIRQLVAAHLMGVDQVDQAIAGLQPAV